MTTSVSIMIIAVVIASIVMVSVWFYLKNRKSSESDGTIIAPPSFEESQGESVHVDPIPQENEKTKPLFSVGDWVVCISAPKDTGFVEGDIVQISCEESAVLFNMCPDCFRLWAFEDAKEGDVLVVGDEDGEGIAICGKGDGIGNNILICYYDEENGIDFAMPIAKECLLHPATLEQQNLLFDKMHEAGYEWNPDTLTLSKVEEEPQTEVQNGEPAVIAPVDEEKPKEEEQTDPCDLFNNLVDYFNQVVVNIEKDGKTYNYLSKAYNKAVQQYYLAKPEDSIHNKDNFPTIVDYYTDEDYEFAFEKLVAWLFYCILAEIVPEKRSELCQLAYDYMEKGKDIPTFGHSFDTDPNNCRMVAACIWAMTRDSDIIPELRKELGGKMLKYKSDISECFLDICGFMPPAPGPWIEGYEKRKNGYPVDYLETDSNTSEDRQTHKYVSQYYTLDTKDAEKRQATIQAIANKEYKKPHLFGKPRTVKDDKYGEMTFNPVFGVHNIGIEIPDNGAIANLCYTVGMASTNNRKPLLNQEYGRRRPGEGDVDGKANNNPSERVLVNFAIEEGDGHTTGYYNQGGDYVDGNGNHIGDYETYYQNAVYANSYPSGHSAYIMGVGLALMMVMPDRADKILKALNEFANSRIICRYHWLSDTIIGRVIGTMMLPVMCGTKNCDIDKQLKECRKEYEAILNGDTPVTDKVNTSLSYVCGGYGSCHVDAGETSLNHYCNKECDRERHPFINVSQRVEFTIEGDGVKTVDGKTSGTWEANTNYELVCPAVGKNEEKIAVITMRNENGVRILNYKLSRQGTKDEGTK